MPNFFAAGVAQLVQFNAQQRSDIAKFTTSHCYTAVVHWLYEFFQVSAFYLTYCLY